MFYLRWLPRYSIRTSKTLHTVYTFYNFIKCAAFKKNPIQRLMPCHQRMLCIISMYYVIIIHYISCFTLLTLVSYIKKHWSCSSVYCYHYYRQKILAVYCSFIFIGNTPLNKVINICTCVNKIAAIISNIRLICQHQEQTPKVWTWNVLHPNASNRSYFTTFCGKCSNVFKRSYKM